MDYTRCLKGVDKKGFTQLNKPMLTQRDIDGLETRFREVFSTREEFQKLKSDIFDKLDAFLKEIRDSHEERTIMAHKLSDHEDRISTLEESRS